jgi:hypothetical protein
VALPAETGRRVAGIVSGMTPTTSTGRSLRELAHRTGDGLEVTLFWTPGTDRLTVCVCNHRDGAYFELHPEPALALDAFYHPYSYADASVVHYQDERLAA